MLIRKDVLGMTVPILTEQIFVVLMGVVNAIMAGRIGKEAVSAIGMVDSLNNVFISMFTALAVGGTVVVAYYTGQRNRQSANDAAKQAFLSGLVIALIITLATWVFRYPLLNILYGSAEQDVINQSFIYLNITLPTYPLIALTSIACGVLRGAGDTRTPMKVTIFMNIINVIFSYILIYGIEVRSGGFDGVIPGMGVKGAALGIAIARTTGALIFIYILLKGTTGTQLTNMFKVKWDWDMQKSIFGVGIPASVEQLLFTGGKLATQTFIVGMGTAAIAANYIATSIFALFSIPGNAMSVASTTLIGQSMGKGDTEEARKTMRYLTLFTSACLLVLSAFLFPMSGLLSSLYTQSQDVIDLSAKILKLSAIFMPLLWALSFVLPAGLRGAGDAKYTMVTSILGMWVFRITLAYFLGVPLGLGVIGIWLGMFADWFVRSILYYVRFKGDKWKRNTIVNEKNQ
ncbi:MAG: efflux family protein [Clostridiales bacterium]|jgi:putative MATE family efflux protein|nr:efflux family protein [Clostridiales bacterium]